VVESVPLYGPSWYSGKVCLHLAELCPPCISWSWSSVFYRKRHHNNGFVHETWAQWTHVATLNTLMAPAIKWHAHPPLSDWSRVIYRSMAMAGKTSWAVFTEWVMMEVVKTIYRKYHNGFIHGTKPSERSRCQPWRSSHWVYIFATDEQHPVQEVVLYHLVTLEGQGCFS